MKITKPETHAICKDEGERAAHMCVHNCVTLWMGSGKVVLWLRSCTSKTEFFTL